jgi:hypothetical protein
MITMRDLLRYLGVLLLFGVGIVHLYEYYAEDYRDVPTIGILFLLNFIGGLVLGLLLAAPLESLPAVRSVPVAGRAAHALVALVGIAYAAATIIALMISETGTLFGYQERSYRPAIMAALAVESAAVVVLAVYLALEARHVRARPSPAREKRSSGFRGR